MGDFFNGWRRKAGLVALAVACVLMVGWMRSCLLQDTFTVSLRLGSQIRLVSASQHLVIATINIRMGNGEASNRERFWTSRRIDAHGWLFTSTNTLPIYFGFHGHSFWIDKHRIDEPPIDRGTSVSVTKLHFPYWSFVLPLTLLSAWLILIKPRKAKGSP